METLSQYSIRKIVHIRPDYTKGRIDSHLIKLGNTANGRTECPDECPVSGAPGETAIRYNPALAARPTGRICPSAIASSGGTMKVASRSCPQIVRVSRRQFAANCAHFRLIPMETINMNTALGSRYLIASSSPEHHFGATVTCSIFPSNWNGRRSK